MTNPNPLIKSVRESSGLRVAVLFGSFFVFLLFSSILTGLIIKTDGVERTSILISSAIQGLLAFCLPAFIVARFSSNDWPQWLKLNKAPSIKAVLGVIILYIVSLPTMDWIVELNNSINFPESLAPLEKLLRSWEDSARETTNAILNSHGVVSMLAGVLIIGVLTGFSEEMFFRGGVQGVFSKSGMGIGLAIWLSACIFSAMHFQFFGFVPRLLMGACFGYLLYWTGSLWVPIIAHALNNGMVVIMAYATGISSSENQVVYPGGMMVVIASVALTLIFLIFFRNYFFKSDNIKEFSSNSLNETSSKWQRNQLPPVSEN